MSGSSDKVDRKDVKRILDMREKGSHSEVLMELKGKPSMWMSVEKLGNCEDLLFNYLQSMQRPRRANVTYVTTLEQPRRVRCASKTIQTNVEDNDIVKPNTEEETESNKGNKEEENNHSDNDHVTGDANNHRDNDHDAGDAVSTEDTESKSKVNEEDNNNNNILASVDANNTVDSSSTKDSNEEENIDHTGATGDSSIATEDEDDFTAIYVEVVKV